MKGCENMNDRDRLIELICTALGKELEKNKIFDFPVVEGAIADHLIENGVTVPVRCKECVHSMELPKHCDINREYHRHCKLWRGEEEKNVWHKYHKYYSDYSLVELDEYCSCGVRKENGDE